MRSKAAIAWIARANVTGVSRAGETGGKVAAKAVAFGEALKPEFRDYAKQIILNSKRLAKFFMENGAKLVTNGTDNHLMLINCVKSWDLPGGDVEHLLDRADSLFKFGGFTETMKLQPTAQPFFCFPAPGSQVPPVRARRTG